MSLVREQLLSGLPPTLREELFNEYDGIVTNFYEGRWRPTELQAGRFCEVVYSIIAGRAASDYPQASKKPDDFPKACRQLENCSGLERGLRMLAARMLPALYEIRNNRDVGHVGGDVDSNFMDSSYAVSATSWLMAELIRIFHAIDAADAEIAVRNLTQIRTPAVWVSDTIRRVLDPSIKLADQCLLLVASAGANVTLDQLLLWTETSKKSYLKKIVEQLHKSRCLEAANPKVSISLLPPGATRVQRLLMT